MMRKYFVYSFQPDWTIFENAMFPAPISVLIGIPFSTTAAMKFMPEYDTMERR